MDFCILGALEARANGTRLPLGGPKQRALLAMLLLEANAVVSRDRLIDGLWGETPPPTASHTLDSYVSRLRKALGDDGERLLTRPPGYLLRTRPGELDLDRFERLAVDGGRALDAGEFELAAGKLREAESLWRGRPLADLEYEQFAQAHVQRLEELALETTEQRVDAELALGRRNGLIAELEALVAQHPLRERLRGQLMLALYRAGRQADALAAFRDGRVLLREELGLDPSPRLQELELAMLRQDPGLGIPSTTPEAPAEPARQWTHRMVVVAGIALCAAGLAAVGLRDLLDAPGEGRPEIQGNTVALLDATSGRTTAATTLRARPAAAASGANSVWMATPDAGSVVRIDSDSGDVRQTVHVGGAPNAVAVGANAVWVADALEGKLSRIDPGTETVVQTIRVGRGPGGVAVGNHVVWVSNTISSTISRINASSGAVVDTAPLEARPGALAIGTGAVWVASESQNRVLRLDPSSGEPQQTIAVGTAPVAIAVGHGAVWVANRLDGTVSRIDTRRDVVSDTFDVGNGPVDLALGASSVWVAGERGTLTEIDPGKRRVVRTLRVGGRPQAVAVAGRDLLVGIATTGASHRGGTLRFVTPNPDFESIDPATLLSVSPPQLLGLTNDGLVSLHRVGGSAGLRVVPDLALTLPTPTDGGKTYSFKLRANIRYSTGRRVEARDFRYAIERVFALESPVATFYRGIVGATACEARRKSCDLSEGIVADDTARRVTFHLSRPDPDFLTKLALPYAYAVPAGSAPGEARRKPLPATGPYMIASYRPGQDLKLVRNPRFREWSTAAQPSGYADAIVWKLDVNLDDALTAVERDRADWVLNYGPLPPDRRREISTRYAAQAHANALPLTHYYFMNTRVPPFDDVRVRRALNYAVDRKALAPLYHGTPTCHVVPPQLPGHSAYCPYRHDPAKARRLIAASGTAGMRVRVINDLRTPDLAYIVRLLRRLGYRASAWIVPGRRYGRTLSDSRNKVQIGSGGWGADYAAASNFFDVKLSCRVFRPASPLNNNDSEFCDRRIEARAEHARRLGLTDPNAATREWERVYADIIDQAPWLPTVTPTWIDFVSERVGNYQFHPLWGILAQQLWVR